jgi:hypothetical protein
MSISGDIPGLSTTGGPDIEPNVKAAEDDDIVV